MKLETYQAILRCKGVDPNAKPDGNEQGFDNATIAFRKDLASNKLAWTGNCFSDFFYFLISEHPLFSWWRCCCGCGVPKLHPYSHKERLYVLICLFFFGSCWAAISILIINNGKKTTNATSWLLDAVGGLFETMVCRVLVFLATCKCVQGSKTETRRCAEKCGHILMGGIGIGCFMTFCIGLAIAIGQEIFSQWFQSFMRANFISWFGWEFLFAFVKFIACYGRQRKLSKCQNDKAHKKWCVTCTDFIEYRNGVLQTKQHIEDHEKTADAGNIEMETTATT